MSAVSFNGARYELADGETVLNGLLRHGVSINFSCKAGVCGSCMMRATAGTVPAKAQSGLRDSWRLRGYFLACSCVPDSDLELAAPGGEFRFANETSYESFQDREKRTARVDIERRFAYPAPRTFKFSEVVTPDAGFVLGVDSNGRNAQSQLIANANTTIPHRLASWCRGSAVSEGGVRRR